jgi:hypothetical protein
MIHDVFLVYDLLFYLCIISVSIVMFFSGLCFWAFICLVLLVDGLSSLLFYIQGFFLFFLFSLQFDSVAKLEIVERRFSQIWL